MMESGINHGSLKRMEQSSNVFLPQNIISDILSWLPVKSLLRFRCVCKSWCALISEPYFMNLQLERAKENPVFLVRPYKAPPLREDVDLYAYREERHESSLLMKWEIPRVGWLHMNPFTCDGLLLFYSATNIHVCNPSTRKFTTLPQGSPNKPLTRISTHHVGLGFDTSTKKYKVVRIFYRDFNVRRGFYDLGCEIFELGSHAWRAVSDPPYPVIDMYPAVMDGVLYWVILYAYERKSAHILSFDLRSERFGVITGPPCTSEPPGKKFILPLPGPGGNLCLIICLDGSSSVDIWMSECSSTKDTWVKQFSIPLDGPGKLWACGILNGKVLLSSGTGLYYYIRERNRMRPVLAIRNKYKSDDDNPWDNAYMSFLNGTQGFQVGIYVESLVRVE